MTKLRATFFLLCLLWGSCAHAETPPEPGSLEVESQSEVDYDLNTGIGIATNGVVVRSGETVMTADKAMINQKTGDIYAEGSVYVRKDAQTWKGDHLHYNFITHQLDSQEFRTGRSPAFAAGEGLHGDTTNHVYTATNVYITADDYDQPLMKIRARHFKLVPGQYFEATHATLYAGKVPLFYFPYYRRSLEEHQTSFTFLPGYRTAYGPYMLGTYEWYANQYLSGAIHADYRERRGFGGGPDFNLNLGQFGQANVKYYATHDLYSNQSNPGLTNGPSIPRNRDRLYLDYEAMPATNLTLRSQIAYQSDPAIIHDFFEGEYNRDVQPNTFFEAEQLWQNWDLDAMAQPRVNDFFETVERLPDVRLTGFRQQIPGTPIYYESESSVGWYRRLFADTNSAMGAFSAARADTFHQLTLPETFFGWLTVTPRVGGRFTYYSEASGPGAVTQEQDRTVFNTGAEISTKLSRTWTGVESHFLDLDGVRHIMEPSIDYVFVPSPNVLPSKLPQFDYELTNSFWLLPIEYPDYNAIDSVDSQNVIRWGLRNRLQTKRKGEVSDFVSWAVYMDWRLRPYGGQTTFSDVYSELVLKPRSWMSISSRTRYDIETGELNLAQHQITLQPNDVWSWSLGHYYLRGGTIFGVGDNLITSVFYYRFNENWGARIAHNFEARDGTLQQQYYTLYRDLRSWTAALTFRVQDDETRGKDYTIAATFSFKAAPHYHLNQDTIQPESLLGY